MPNSATTLLPAFHGFAADALAAMAVPGIPERWAAVQQRLHPQFVALAARIDQTLAQRFPREWPVYEQTYKDARFLNRGPAGRAPIEEYHLAIDRPPRGAGLYVVVSAAERSILVAIQLWGLRKPALRRAWETGRALWEPELVRCTDVRFAETAQPVATPQTEAAWMDRYLSNRRAAYLLAGFRYAWDDPLVASPAFADQVCADLVVLFPLLEQVLEQAEQREPHGAALLREHRAHYQLEAPAIDTIIQRIQGRGLALPADTIRAYHLALQTKPLVILPGVSGTGKTLLTRLYADAVHSVGAGQENERYLLVAVQPDWHNARDLLGYYNAITNKFHATPFLRFVLRAASEPGATYFVCLDELNLARPEYYLAPILSAIETSDRLIDLGVPAAMVETVDGMQLQNPMRLPINLAFTGTVNVDESTHPLSDKLLDRANLIELSHIDLNAFRANYHGSVDPQAWQILSQIHAAVSRAGHPFGYRSLHEILRYLEHSQDMLTPNRALDQQLKQKVLPRLRGEETPRLRRALTELLDLALGMPLRTWGNANAVPPEALAAAPMPESAEKLCRMLERLDTDGFTDFYG